MKNDFKIRVVFELEKDNFVYSSQLMYYIFKEKYGLSEDEAKETYRSIVNYQIKKYGITLSKDDNSFYDKVRK